ncbi:2472_t:CDS:1, partial [Racocetra persica]
EFESFKIEAANERIFQLLKDAADNFYKAVSLDTNIQVKEIMNELEEQKEQLLAIKFMIARKEVSPKEDMKDLKINPLDIKDCNDNTYIAGINIQKRKYIVDDVVVKKAPISDERKIVKQAKIVKLLNACDNIEKL